MSDSEVAHRAFANTSRHAFQKPVRTAVVCPVDDVSLIGALEAQKAGAIVPVLVGPRAAIAVTAYDAGVDIGKLEVVNAEDAHDAAVKAAALASRGSVGAIMKGRLHTDELMAAVVDRKAGLRTGRRMSHVFSLDVPRYHKALHITDAALNIAPDLKTKRSIAANAITLLHALGVETPKVAVMSATETPNENIPSSMDAAILANSSDNEEFAGALVDGPFAFDNAISAKAARQKKIVSPVAGDADVLLVPRIEAGNMLAKQLVYFADSLIAGIVLGAKIPVILTSRADNVAARIASCRLAQVLVAHAGQSDD